MWTGFDDEEALSRGVYDTYTKTNLRYSQVAPRTMYTESNTGTNLPAQVSPCSADRDAIAHSAVAMERARVVVVPQPSPSPTSQTTH